MRGKSVTIFCSGLLVFFFLGLIVGAGAQVESFYRGKTVTIVVGSLPETLTISGRAPMPALWEDTFLATLT